jgi:hypothetical protein
MAAQLLQVGNGNTFDVAPMLASSDPRVRASGRTMVEMEAWARSRYGAGAGYASGLTPAPGEVDERNAKWHALMDANLRAENAYGPEDNAELMALVSAGDVIRQADGSYVASAALTADRARGIGPRISEGTLSQIHFSLADSPAVKALVEMIDVSTGRNGVDGRSVDVPTVPYQGTGYTFANPTTAAPPTAGPADSYAASSPTAGPATVTTGGVAAPPAVTSVDPGTLPPAGAPNRALVAIVAALVLLAVLS